MKIAIEIGHNCPFDSGANGIIKEDILAKELGEKLIKLFRQVGHQTILVTPITATSENHSLRQRVEKANQNQCDLYLSIHFNAFYGRAYGSEVFYYSKQNKYLADRVLSEICKLGFHRRRTESKSFYVLRETKMPAILIESCFCDSIKDMNLYNSDLMAIAIKNGVLGHRGIFGGASFKPEQPARLIVRHATWIKGSVQQSASLIETKKITEISEQNKYFLNKGIYTLIDIDPMEEGHYYVKFKSGLAGFVYRAHVEIKLD